MEIGEEGWGIEKFIKAYKISRAIIHENGNLEGILEVYQKQKNSILYSQGNRSMFSFPWCSSYPSLNKK
jgi:hypothetical protein